MSERIINGYKRLFEIRLLHHYWLDEGATVFDKMTDQTKKNSRLSSYDVRRFLAVKPTRTTEQRLAAYRCVFKETALGCIVAAPANARFPDDTALDFVVTITHSRFFEYTALTLRPQSIFEFYNEPEKVVYRYKANVPTLSNLSGATRGVGADMALFLSQENPVQFVNEQVESLAQAGNALVQLTSDGPGASTQVLGANAADFPVYLHQGDVPAITPPPGFIGVPSKGILLSSEIPDNVFACLSVTAQRADNSAFSFVDAMGNVKATAPIYQVRFKNRSTVWKYVDKRTHGVTSTEAQPLPLTYFGNAGSKQKPSEGLVAVEKSGQKVTRLVSEIYV